MILFESCKLLFKKHFRFSDFDARQSLVTAKRSAQGFTSTSFLSRVSDYLRDDKCLTNLVFSDRTVRYWSYFFPCWITARVPSAGQRKKPVRNLQYGPRTRLVRGKAAATTSDFLLAPVMWFFQVLSRRLRARVATLGTNFGDKLKASRIAYFKRPAGHYKKTFLL